MRIAVAGAGRVLRGHHTQGLLNQAPSEGAGSALASAVPTAAAPIGDALLRALEASEAGRFSYWDAMLLATAGEAGCEAVISEDMGHGAKLGPVRVVRAFDGGMVSAEARALLS